MTPEELAAHRERWQNEPLDDSDIEGYRANYDAVGWSEISTKAGHAFVVPVGAVVAIERLCCEIERLRKEANN